MDRHYMNLYDCLLSLCRGRLSFATRLVMTKLFSS